MECFIFQIAVSTQWHHFCLILTWRKIFSIFKIFNIRNFHDTDFWRDVTNAGTCLLNTPWTALQLIDATNPLYLPGQFYTIDQQCQLNIGPKATYTNYCKVCHSILKNFAYFLLGCFFFETPRDPICETLYCGPACMATSGFKVFSIGKYNI